MTLIFATRRCAETDNKTATFCWSVMSAVQNMCFRRCSIDECPELRVHEEVKAPTFHFSSKNEQREIFDANKIEAHRWAFRCWKRIGRFSVNV